MPPARAKKTRASISSNEAIPSLPAPPTMIAIHNDEEQHTPERSPGKRVAGITQAQKQALVDNLQLEITERARKLRAQYALQAQGLRARLEMRVNRIPQALRKRNMQDLLDEHSERAKPAPPPPVPAKDTVPERSMVPVARSPERKSLKRQSDHVSHDHNEDKENEPAQSSQDLPNPKKRAKTATATANIKATRTASRKVVPSTVLSPKSHNSRTLPRSPFKSAALPEKASIPHYASPIKHLAPPPNPASRAASRQGSKRGAGTPTDPEGRSSEASMASAGTTIVTKPGAKKGAAGKKPAAAKTTAASRAKKGDVAPAPAVAAGGGRTLRKRG